MPLSMFLLSVAFISIVYGCTPLTPKADPPLERKCAAGKILKEVVGGKNICCKPDDNYVKGSGICCTKGRVARTAVPSTRFVCCELKFTKAFAAEDGRNWCCEEKFTRILVKEDNSMQCVE
uniref:Activin_recp domain-containing protein n=1 Tax=Steinernema glaseri TaxID=37863 RepID=A0A1I7ZD57_9BILA